MTALAYPLRRALAANSTASAFTAKVPSATKPGGVGIFDVFDANLGYAIDTKMPKFINLIPYGSDANDETFSMRLWGWSRVENPGADDHNSWVPILLLQLDVTLGNIAMATVAANHFLADTIAVGKGADEESGSGASVISTTNDTPGSILCHLRGVEVIEFDFDMTGAAGGNCYWRLMDEN
jgi:hypothetical protein